MIAVPKLPWHAGVRRSMAYPHSRNRPTLRVPSGVSCAVGGNRGSPRDTGSRSGWRPICGQLVALLQSERLAQLWRSHEDRVHRRTEIELARASQRTHHHGLKAGVLHQPLRYG